MLRVTNVRIGSVLSQKNFVGSVLRQNALKVLTKFRVRFLGRDLGLQVGLDSFNQVPSSILRVRDLGLQLGLDSFNQVPSSILRVRDLVLGLNLQPQTRQLQQPQTRNLSNPSNLNFCNPNLREREHLILLTFYSTNTQFFLFCQLQQTDYVSL